MTPTFPANAVVLDIEGTTSSTAFVTDVLYPYSRRRFRALLTERAHEPDVRRAADQARSLLGEPEADAARLEQALNAWLDEDRKAAPLKTLQGIVWAEAFARGELTSHFYEDVPPVLRRWHAAGVRLHVYSSGSVAAQRAWLGHSVDGDLLPLVDGLFDTENAGPKNEPDSYRTVAEAVATPPEALLFLSDRPSELDAASDAGWLTARLVRPGEPYAQHADDRAKHPAFVSFTDIRLTPPGETS